MPYRYLTDAEARELTRSELLERIADQQDYYQAKKRKTQTDEAAMAELSRIMHRYIDVKAAFADVYAALNGRTGPSYWDARAADDPALPQEEN